MLQSGRHLTQIIMPEDQIKLVYTSGLRMGWDGTKKSSHGTKCFVPSHPMGFPKKKSHPIPSHGIDNSSHPIPWVPWDERNIKRLLKTWINFHDFLIQSSQFPPICSQLDLFIWHLFFILTTNPIELLNNRLRSYWCENLSELQRIP